MRFVIGIDVGIRNLGICVFDFALAKFVLWDVCNLVPTGKYRPGRNVDYVRDFVERYRAYFDDMAQLVIEKQMRCNMRIIEAIFQTIFFEKCVVVAPVSVKRHYLISTGDYKTNKEAAVEFVNEFVSKNSSAFTLLARDRYDSSKKSDDMADALINVLYYLDTYSNQLTENADIVLF